MIWVVVVLVSLINLAGSILVILGSRSNQRTCRHLIEVLRSLPPRGF